MPAQRLVDGQLSSAEAAEDQLALWVLPPGTTTRALRFKHEAEVTDLTYDGRLSGVLVLSERFENAALSARASTGSNSSKAARINNGAHDGWGAWENQEKDKAPPTSKVISPENPEWLALVWPQAVKLKGLAALWAGVDKVEVQVFTGKGLPNPKDARQAGWESMGVYEGVKHAYSSVFWPNKLEFPREVETKGVRLRVMAAGKTVTHAKTNEGKRIWLGELMALSDLGTAPLVAGKVADKADIPPPPIPVRFTLKEAAFVTLVIEKANGFRVRNLVSETWFPAGDNLVWWDGTDDLIPDSDAAMHGLYRVTGNFVEPGEYVVRGLVRGAIKPHFEFTVYTTGNPPWSTADNTGAWLANHSPPQAAAFVPAKQSPTGADVVYLGCYVTEGPAGLAWVDLQGNKMGGKKWIGGNWTAAPFLAHDAGSKAVPGVYVYVGSVWETGKKSGESELRITALTPAADKPVLVHKLGATEGSKDWVNEIAGIAAYDGLIVVSQFSRDQLLLVDAAAGKIVGNVPVKAPRGVAFDSAGKLLVISGKTLVRFDSLSDVTKVSAPKTLIASGLEEPMSLTVDASDAIYISDHGNSHQVKVFDPQGKSLRSIGKAGLPKAGPYDRLHMNQPMGIAVDSQKQIWVTEHDFLPKRVSVWSQDGKLIRAFYGPGKYGGGGSLDPQDKNVFYYADEKHGSLEFKLDWDKGTYEPSRVLFRVAEGDMEMPFRSAAPETALYHDGRRYFTNAYNSSPTGGHNTAFVFAERDGIVRHVAGAGKTADWPLLQTEDFRAGWPEETDWESKSDDKKSVLFLWADLNEDARVQPDEVAFQKAAASGITVMPDLSFCIARVVDKTMKFSPTTFSATGVPHYDITKGSVLASGVQGPASSGGNQVIDFGNGWTAITLGINPFSRLAISGAKDGMARWSYPSPWPGLHASHRAPRPDAPGQLIGTTRLLGGGFDVKGSDAGPFWALHSNHGMSYIFTYDGLFVATLFEDMRGGKTWKMPSAVRNMSLEGVTLGEENFWPSITSSEGKAFLVDGARSALVRLDGMESIKRLPDTKLSVGKADLEKSRSWQVEAEAARQRSRGDGILHAALLRDRPVVDGKIEDWSDADWAEIDSRGVKANFNADSKPYDIKAAVAVAGDRLYAAWKTGDDQLLKNSGEMPVAPFKTGGALDLMIATNPSAPVDRKEPVAGDLRLLVTVVQGKPKALLYRAVVAGTKDADKVPFSSPWRTLTFDRVDDVSSQIEFSGNAGDFEISIPLGALGLKVADGTRIKGDIGILRGNGTETTARVYWNNKATGIVSDVPDEARLTPNLWGTWEFKNP